MHTHTHTHTHMHTYIHTTRRARRAISGAVQTSSPERSTSDVGAASERCATGGAIPPPPPAARARRRGQARAETTEVTLPSPPLPGAQDGDPRANQPRVLILFAGPAERSDSLANFLRRLGARVLAIDVKTGGIHHDATRAEVRAVLLARIRAGEFHAVFASLSQWRTGPS